MFALHVELRLSGDAADHESVPRRLDRAIDRLMGAGHGADAVPVELAPLMEAATRVRSGLPLVAPGPLFEQRLAALLEALRRAERPVAVGAARQRRLLAGAIGSAAVSLAGVTAVAVWRAAHRHS